MRLMLGFLLAMIAASAAAQMESRPAEVPFGSILVGRFIQERHLSGFEAPLISEGTFVLAPGRGMIWRMISPFQSATVIGQKVLLQIAPGGEVSRLPVSRMPLIGQILVMMEGTVAGRWNVLESQFNVQQQATPAGWLVVLTPRDDQSALAAQVEVIEGKGGRFLERLMIRRGGGDFDVITFSDMTISSSPLSPQDGALFGQAS